MLKNATVIVAILLLLSSLKACQNPVDSEAEAVAYQLSGNWYSLDSQDEFASSSISTAAAFDPIDGPLHSPDVVPDDPLFSEQWNLSQLDMPAVWSKISGSSSVVVAVIDTGVDTSLSDFAGVSFVHPRNVVNDTSDVSDHVGHGTHVAGTIAQATNNALGTAGMASGVTIMPVKVFDSSFQTTPDLIGKGVDWARSNGANVINLSLGDPTGSSDMTAVFTAIEQAVSDGAVVIAATGNSGDAVRAPATADDVIAVGGTAYGSTIAAYSCYGPEVDVVAPGGASPAQVVFGFTDAILQQSISTFDPIIAPGFPEHPTSTGYYYTAGTSQAAPHVSALAALLLSVDPTLTVQEVRDAIEGTAIDLGDPGRDDYYGHGLIDPVAALTFGINSYSSITRQVSAPEASGTVHDLWRIAADAGIIDLTLSDLQPSLELGLYLYDQNGKLVARAAKSAKGVRLQHDVELQGGEYYLLVSSK